MTSIANGASYGIGQFECPSLLELRERGELELEKAGGLLVGELTVKHAMGDVSVLIGTHPLSVVQAASQFNCLEFTGPSVLPEDGVTGYAHDRTQGPACSIACGPATVYRNYFAPLVRPDGSVQEGQTEDCQIENLAEISDAIGNKPEGRFYRVVGGYTLAENQGLEMMNHELKKLNREDLKAKLRVGVHSDVQVTSSHWGNRRSEREEIVTMVFGSACSITYSRNHPQLWEPFATMILEASYEATLWAAVLHALRHKDDPRARVVFLTALGGGVFGNDLAWIAQAIDMACDKFKGLNLDVRIVSYCPPVDRNLDMVVQKYACK